MVFEEIGHTDTKIDMGAEGMGDIGGLAGIEEDEAQGDMFFKDANKVYEGIEGKGCAEAGGGNEAEFAFFSVADKVEDMGFNVEEEGLELAWLDGEAVFEAEGIGVGGLFGFGINLAEFLFDAEAGLVAGVCAEDEDAEGVHGDLGVVGGSSLRTMPRRPPCTWI